MQTEYGQHYATLYNHHWWWQARQAMLLSLIKRYDLAAPAGTRDRRTGCPQHIDSLDVGCGDGLFMQQLAKFGTVRGIEADTSLLTDDNLLRDRIDTELLGHRIYQNRTYDLITALDVIEHIENDRNAVADMFNMLRPGGHLLITVPAFMSLWDQHDEMNQHYRRYNRKTLRRLVEPFGQVRNIRYLFHGIFLPKWTVAKLNKNRADKIEQHHLPKPWVNAVMRLACRAEFALASHLPAALIPFGTSVCAIIQKPHTATLSQPQPQSLAA